MVLRTHPHQGQGRLSRRSPNLDQTLSALADGKRRAVIDRLRAGPCKAGDLARELDTTPASLSRHLRVLRKSGLVEEHISEEDARVRFYRLRREPFADLRSWVERVESFWDDQLAAFKAHAERGKR